MSIFHSLWPPKNTQNKPYKNGTANTRAVFCAFWAVYKIIPGQKSDAVLVERVLFRVSFEELDNDVNVRICLQQSEKWSIWIYSVSEHSKIG